MKFYVELIFRQHFILVYVNLPLKVDWGLITMSISPCQTCGYLFLRMFLTMNGAWIRLYYMIVHFVSLSKGTNLLPCLLTCIFFRRLVNGQWFWTYFQIVSTLMGNRQYSNKMLVYAENHNQVLFTFNPFFGIKSSLYLEFKLLNHFYLIFYHLLLFQSYMAVNIWRAFICRDIVWSSQGGFWQFKGIIA